MRCKKKWSYLFYIVVFLMTTSIACRSAKKISSSNPTYLNINYDNISDWIDWKEKSYRNIFFDEKKEGDINVDLPLHVKTNFSKSKKVRQLESLPLFIMDTINRNNSGYYRYTENPIYFEDLHYVEAHTSQIKEDYTVGKYKEELLNKGFSYRDIAFVLIQFGLIGTYDHLFSEMVIMRKKDTPEFHEIHYNCVYHICTSRCFDPKYKFFIRFDKKTKLITIGKI